MSRSIHSMDATPNNANLAWDFTRIGAARRCMAAAAFAVAYGALVLLGYVLRDDSESLTIMWPASGLLLVALLTTPPRAWVWVLLIQCSTQLMLYFIVADSINWRWGPMFVAANSLEAVVAAALAAFFLIPAPAVTQARRVLRLVAAMALGSAASATLGAFASIHTAPSTLYFRQWQLWWANSWLGALFLAPALLTWMVRWRSPAHTAPPPATGELLLLAAAQLGLTLWLFGSPAAALTNILHPHTLLLALVIFVAFRLPSRWATTLASVTVLIATYDASRGLGPFAGDPNPFVRIGAVQLWLATLLVINYLLGAVLFEKRHALDRLRRSEERYRNFVEKSSEAVWQIELDEPMPLDLPLESQIDWLHHHAQVTECNQPYREMNRHIGIPDSRMHEWRADVPWSHAYLTHFTEASRHEYSMDGLQFTLPAAYPPTVESKTLTYMSSFSGVVVDGRLSRLWGVARDITALVELNQRLKIKQERVQMYARQLTSAEERARRATAVDLHDGIGQQLVGIALTLDAAMSRSPPEARLLLGEAIHTLREVHGITQRVIADLSPPGLYELGLEPALQWLSVYMRGRDQLQVTLQVKVDDSAFDLDLRILVFKLIRELLRNVVKHSGVKAATVTVSMTPQHLRLEVADAGVGFEWQLSLFETPAEGFGLWSVAERIREAAGEMIVDTAPGRGCRVTIIFPLQRDASLLASVPNSRGRENVAGA